MALRVAHAGLAPYCLDSRCFRSSRVLICMIRVFIAADVRFYRDGLAEVISRHSQCVVLGTGSTRAQVVQGVIELRPDIVLLDTGTPEGVEVVRELASRAPSVKVLAIALDETEHAVLEWAEAGVGGYVPRDASLADLIAAIERAARGEQQCSTKVAGGMLRRLAALARVAGDRQSASPSPQLTPREREIICLLGHGMSNKDIARQLGIEVTTTKSHVHHILEKLQVRGRSQAAARMRLGWPAHSGEEVHRS